MSKFKVLWIDDQTQKCKRDSRSVKKIIESMGFEPDIKFEDDISRYSLNDPNGVLNKAIRARDVDLFVIDYNLKNDIFGSDIIREIRNDNDIYTDIVFYSSDTKSLVDAIKNSFDASSIMDFCDGVYVVPLGDEFLTKIQYVITKIIKSWYNVHSIRGVLLSKASKFEQMVSDIIAENYHPCLSTIKSELEKKGVNVTRSTCGKWEKVGESDDPVSYILHDPINFNWSVKKLILKILVDKNVIALPNWDALEQIFSLRNDFAHNPIHLRDGKLVLTKNGQDVLYGESDIATIRAALTLVEGDLIAQASHPDEDGMAAFDVKKELCAV